jgi:hypothetical protein
MTDDENGGSDERVDRSASGGPKETTDSDSSDWISLVAILLLSFTAIVTAWTGFQASKWGGEMSIAFTQAGATRLEASSLAADADRWRGIQINSFGEWLIAESQDDQKAMDVISDRFQVPLDTAFVAWLATDPFENPNALPSPFQMPEYRTELSDQAEETNARADALFAEGLENNQRGDNYTILAVLGAVVLFFTAMSTRVKQGRNQWILLGTALVLFVGIVGFLIAFPKLV